MGSNVYVDSLFYLSQKENVDFYFGEAGVDITASTQHSQKPWISYIKQKQKIMKNGEKKVDWLMVLGLRNDMEGNSLGLIFASYVLD